MGGHDSAEFYESVRAKVPYPERASIHIFKGENVWKNVALISKASFVVSTSLHVRIMAFIHARPRLTFCAGGKHIQFLNTWEAGDPIWRHCVIISDNWTDLAEQALQTDQGSTRQAVQEAISMYTGHFANHVWPALVNVSKAV